MMKDAKHAPEDGELGDLYQPGARVWSYTGVCYSVTLGWKLRKYKRYRRIALKGEKVVDESLKNLPGVKNFIGKVHWHRLDWIAKTKQYRRKNNLWTWHERWQTTPK